MENIHPQKMDSKIASASKMKGAKTIEETYTKKTQLEHILLRPDTYVGSVEKQTQPMWVYDCETEKIVHRPCTFVPGLYKIFDEIVVNAADNKQRDPTMNRIDVTITPSENLIRVRNNGTGVPVAIHQEHKIYVPELIFGNLLTGSNFDDNEEKTTGGRNGYGAKLANIFSTRFIVETSDKTRKLKYSQQFHDNMRQKSVPEVTTATGDDFTCITFYPDLRRFKMTALDDDIVSLLSKRVYDIAATNMASGPKLSVYLNGKRIETRTFEQYIGIYQGLEPACGFEKTDPRWEIGVGLSDGTFQQVSFVNSICTTKGGQHVNYIADQVAARLVAVVKKKNKGQEVKANQIKNHLAIYVNSLITNPAFDSQTKENLTTKPTAFGSTCTVSEKLFKQVEKSGIVDNILNWAKFKQNAELKKKGGSKRSKLVGITKLDDANFAGSSKSQECTLILTEGDSAKALAISGLGVVGRDYYGVFPLKGKLLNVREASHAQIMKNEEVQNIAKILGLTFGKDYSDTLSLRYGHLMIMTDQDHDGSHIKGLLINFIHHFWPSLLKINNFLQQFITPIVKCTKGNKEITFFTIPEYHQWKQTHNDGKGFKIKYYKGLGTSTAAEAKEYFSHLTTHQIEFLWDDRADDMVEMAFAKKRVEDRKLWLLGMEPGVYIDYGRESVTYNEFINHELILFSHADNERSIPHFMDGFKPSQRKVLFSCFKRNLKHEIKVAQLAGYISEHSAYHHGEASLTQTIIGMAQNFVGSNNINLLSPCGQFGTRLMGGKDAASPRYVFTKLELITRHIFHPDDDALLNYLDDDGQSIEPTYYVPVIPMALVNGSDGIGTGWSTSVPTYNPREIISNLRLIISGQQPKEMKPWYRGFIGDIDLKAGGNYTVAGLIESVDEGTIVIKELPVGKWTTDYKQFLESMLIGNASAPKEGEGTPPPAIVKDFKENHTDTTVSFTVMLPPEKLAECLADKNGIYRKFKLETSISTSNMHLFDRNSQIKKFESASEILLAFYDVRLEFYQKRKLHLLHKLTEEWDQLDNKVRFILDVIEGKLVVANRRKQELLSDLRNLGFKSFVSKSSAKDVNDDESVDSTETATEAELDKGYDYLLSMKIWSLTYERVVALTNQRDEKQRDLAALDKKSPEDLWIDDLDALELALDAFEGEYKEAERLEAVARSKATSDRAKGKAGVRAKAIKKATYDDDDDDVEDIDDFDSDFESKNAKKQVKPALKKAQPRATPIITNGLLVPRKILADKPVVVKEGKETKPSKALATAQDSTVVAKEKRASPTEKKPSVYEIGSDDDSVYKPVVTLSLAQRIALKRQSLSPGSSALAPATVTASSASALTAYSLTSTSSSTAPMLKLGSSSISKPIASIKAAPKPRNKKAPTKANKDDSDDEGIDENKDYEVVGEYLSATVTRAPRAAAPTKILADDIDGTDDDEDEFEDDDDDDFDFDEDIPKKKVPTKTKLTKTSTSQTTVKSTANTATYSVKSKAASPPKVVKRAKPTTKRSDDDDDDTVNFSPKKRAKKGSPTGKVPAIKKTVPSKSSAASSAPVASKKTAATLKKKSAGSDDDLDDDSDVEIIDNKPTVIRSTPKPSRSRKQTNYADYFDNDDDDDLDEKEDEY